MNTNTTTQTEPVENASYKSHNGHKDWLSGIVTGIIFVLAGGWLLLDTHIYLSAGWLWWFVFSAGIVMLGEAVIRFIAPQFKSRFYHALTWGCLLTTFGAGNIFDLENIWPVAFIFVGLILILHSQKTLVKHTA